MQKIINAIAIGSGIISLTVVGSGLYLVINKDAIIQDIKSKVIESVMPKGIGGALTGGGLGGGLSGGLPGLPSPAPGASMGLPIPGGF